jgi:hypothetical protein
MKLDKRDHTSLVSWAADCAGNVLPCLKEKYPTDDRLRNLRSST